MANFPTAPCPRVGTKETTVIPIVKSESEGNYTKVRRVATRSRKKFELKYNALTLSEFQILETFFIDNQGSSFTFTHPSTAVEYECIFNQSELKKDFTDTKIVNTDIVLEEV